MMPTIIYTGAEAERINKLIKIIKVGDIYSAPAYPQYYKFTIYKTLNFKEDVRAGSHYRLDQVPLVMSDTFFYEEDETLCMEDLSTDDFTIYRDKTPICRVCVGLEKSSLPSYDDIFIN